MPDHGDQRVDVIRVHVRRDWRAEPRDGIHGPVRVLRSGHTAGAREPADEPGAEDAVHPVPREVSEIHPEGVGMFREVRLTGLLRVGGIGDGLDGAGDGDAGVRGALEPWGGDGEGAFAVRLEVAGVPAHG